LHSAKRWILTYPFSHASAAIGPQMQAKSASVPFLNQPKKLDGSMVGDVGFDPLGISTLGDIKFLREAEIKHGRVAMLAAAGAIAQDIFKFPVRPSDLAAHEACVERLAGAPAWRQSPSLTPTSLAFSIVC
jgi:hypothetical protein